MLTAYRSTAVPRPLSRVQTIFRLTMSVPLFGRVWTINVEFVYSADHTRRVPRSTVALIAHSFHHLFGTIWVALRHFSDMALFDFYQLAVLYKLRLADAGLLPVHSHPLMSATPPPHSPSPSVEPDLAHLSPSLPTQPAFKTPERKQSRSQPLPDTTPLARGSSVRQRQEGDTDRVEGYKREDYDDYIREDLECRVFVDFEVFMKHVLHVPDDWRTKWAPAIEAVKANRDFTKHLNEYRKHCNTSSAQESSFYKPLVAIANTILGVLSQSKFNGISSGIPQYYRVNDPKKLRGGVINKAGLSPDLVALHEDCKPSREGSLHWANPLHILEVKPSGGALCEGKGMPRLVVDGKRATSPLCGRL